MHVSMCSERILCAANTKVGGIVSPQFRRQLGIISNEYSKMSLLEPYTCRFCPKRFESKRSLTQHQQRWAPCKAKLRASFAPDGGSRPPLQNFNFAINETYVPPETTVHDSTILPSIINNEWPSWLDSTGVQRKQQQSTEDDRKMPAAVPWQLTLEESDDEDEDEESMEEDDEVIPFGDDDEEEFSDDDEESDSDEPDVMGINTEILENWEDYVARAKEDFDVLSPQMQTAIRLMLAIRRKKASLDTYNDVLEWHLRECGKIRENERASDSFDYISRQVLFKKLRNRYNMPTESLSVVQKVFVPHAKSRADVVVNDARLVMQQLLTDPRIMDEDYLFWGNDPFSPPPDDLDYVADLNTGLAYTETWHQLITNPGKQVLMPVVLYIDGAVTGQFNNLPITPVRMSLGIFTRKARNRDFMWGTLGYIPHITAEKSRGRRLLVNSGHVDGIMRYPDLHQGEGALNNDVHPTQDLHTMLDVVLKGFIDLQNSGFEWSLFYNGKWYENIEFIPYVHVIRVDTDEADKLTGHYTARSGGVKNICRYCTVPTDETDNYNANYRLKTQKMVQRLIDRGEETKLKAISQHPIQNSMYNLRFGCHNDMGVHGACPMELLHAMLLGIFPYTRDMLYEQIGGEDSKASREIDSLSTLIGKISANIGQFSVAVTRIRGKRLTLSA